MDRQQQEILGLLIRGLQNQLALIEHAAREGNVKSATADLQMTKYLISRALEVLTDAPDQDATLVAYGPSVSPTNRINGPRFREMLMNEMRKHKTVSPKDILRSLQGKGVPLPGKGDSANIVSHLRTLIDDGLVTRTDYGDYQLTPKGRRHTDGNQRPSVQSTE